MYLAVTHNIKDQGESNLDYGSSVQPIVPASVTGDAKQQTP